MIDLQKGLEDYNELKDIIRGVIDINSLVALITHNGEFKITNDLRDTDWLIDVNYKSICATIKQRETDLIVERDIEVWGESGMVDINIYKYSKYSITDLGENGASISYHSPYDDQEYYYSIGNKICRDGHLFEYMEYNDNTLNEIDQTILRLMELNKTLTPKMCHN